MFDVHCHINDEQFAPDLEDVLARARAAGVEGLIDSAMDARDGARSLELAAENPGFVFTSLGLHPLNADPEEFRAVVELIRRNIDRIVALGEVGLDYWWGKEEEVREVQRRYFREFIALSKELHKPVIVHSRSAGKYALGILLEEGAESVLMHAFDGKPVHALRGVEAGYFFSIPPSIVRSEQKVKLARTVPLENLLLETDSPVLGPDKKERNEPANLPLVAKALAEIKGVPEETVIRVTRENTLRLFQLHPHS